jgi:hypothetical protein
VKELHDDTAEHWAPHCASVWVMSGQSLAAAAAISSAVHCVTVSSLVPAATALATPTQLISPAAS